MLSEAEIRESYLMHLRLWIKTSRETFFERSRTLKVVLQITDQEEETLYNQIMKGEL